MPRILQPTWSKHQPEKRTTPAPFRTPLFVLRKDVKTATTDADNPFATAISTDANALLHLIAVNPNAPWLDLILAVGGSGSISTPPAIRCFGWLPNPDNPATNFLDRAAYDSTNFNAADHATLLGPTIGDLIIGQGNWVPLYRRTDGAHVLTFSTTPEIDKSAGVGNVPALRLIHNAPDADAAAQPAHVFCGGFSHVIATVSTALVGPDAGMLLGSFYA